MRWKSWLIIIVALALSGAIFGFFAHVAFQVPGRQVQAPEPEAPQKLESPLITFIDPVKGSDDAPHVIVMYADYVCPYCREAMKAVNRLLNDHGGDVRFVWKNVPNPAHNGADAAAEAALCAKDQGKFWEYHALLIEDGASFNHSSLALAANSLGLDLDRFTACLSRGTMRPLVERSTEEARALGVDGTPYFFIDGKRHSGLLSYEQLVEAVSP